VGATYRVNRRQWLDEVGAERGTYPWREVLGTSHAVSSDKESPN